MNPYVVETMKPKHGMIDHPLHNDNRSYDYEGFRDTDRPDYADIVSMIPHGSRVIDLGCGNGALLQRLEKERSVTGTGVEISESGVQICRSKGLTVYQARIDEPLPYGDDVFEYAICHVTIQMVMYPEILVQEMRRIARFQIISFPNFAFYKNRLELLTRGRMPKRMLFGYRWYSTGHIHQLSMSDFLELVREIGGLKIIKQKSPSTTGRLKRLVMSAFPNLLQPLFIVLLQKQP